MAIYHLSGSVISRSQGRSAVACSAYRSGQELYDAKYDKTHDYTYKQDVAFSEILLPSNAPDWMKEREALWNAVEACEKRKDAQLAREIQISLPRELTLEQNIALARDYIQTQFVDQGMVADWAMHCDKTPSGEAQPHVHVMLTMREVTEEGFGQKVRDWNKKEYLELWRESWAQTANGHLALHGHDIQIDHRSNAERGIDLEPQHKIGASVARDHMARLEDHVRIARENGEKIFSDPHIALDAVTRQQSTFTHHDLARFIHRHTVDAEQFAQVFEKVKSSEHIVALGFDEQGRERFTTQDMLNLEAQMLAHGNILIDRASHHVGINAQQHGMLSRALSDEQQYVYEYLLSEGDLKCVLGYAGTGKSYLLGAAREAWEAEGYHVKGVTLAGIAAENLEASSGIESRTLASRFYYWDKGEELLTSKDVLVVDEAGLIGSRQMERLLNEAQKHHAKVILIGDPQQLQAIEAGAAFRALSEHAGYVELTEVRRQQHAWQRMATQELANGKTCDAIERYQRHDAVHEFETQAMAKQALVEQWNDTRISENDKTQLMLAYTRKDVKELNEMARDARKALGELGQEHLLSTAKGEKPFAAQDRVYFLQNDRGLGVKNGSLGTIEKIEGLQVTIRLDTDPLPGRKALSKVIVDVNHYNHLDYGYAATIHKAQGVTVDRSYVLASKHMDSHATYVGMSRHRESAALFWSREEFANARALTQTLERERHKDVTLDYGELRKEFAKQRGIDVSDNVTKEVQNAIEPSKTQEDKPSLYEALGIVDIDEKEFKAFSFDGLQEHQAQKERDDLMQFKQQFERENPELAKALSYEVCTESEKHAIAVEQVFKQLEKQLQQNPKDYEAKRALAQLASDVAKDNAILQHMKDRSPELTVRILTLAKARERSFSQEISL